MTKEARRGERMRLLRIKEWVFKRIVYPLFKEEIDELIKESTEEYQEMIDRLDWDLSEAYSRIDYLEQRIYELEQENEELQYRLQYG